MSYCLLLLTALAACVSARFTVPVPIHYEIETLFQRQTGVPKMRWDPTNYLTYLAAVYSQCSNIYAPSSTTQRNRINNNTAYGILLQFFDPSLLQNNLVTYVWDVTSDSSQDAGTVDRDIRRLGNRNNAGALTSFNGVDGTLRGYDRFGCSVETQCVTSLGQSMMTLVCIFGQSVPSRFVAANVNGNGNNQPAVPSSRPTSRPIPATTRPRVRPQVRGQFSGGFYDTYSESSAELYDTVINNWPSGSSATNYMSAEVAAQEQKLISIGLCNYEYNPNAFTADVLRGYFNNDAQTLIYGYTPSSLPSQQDMLALPMSDYASTIIRSAIAQQLGPDVDAGESIACAWAVCSEKVLVGCAVWDIFQYGRSVN